MSYVDISWPWGLFFLGLSPVLYTWSVPSNPRTLLVMAAYITAGLRMGLGAVIMAARGHLSRELPRYEYQRQRWAKKGVTKDDGFSYMMTMQGEIMVQCLANMGLLSIPVMLQTAGYLSGPLTLPEIAGWILWCLSMAWEHIADMQKLQYAREAKAAGRKGGVCERGLWSYSRHPNYFGEWMVWNSLILTSIPTAIAMFEVESSLIVKLGLSLGLAQISSAMYNCLVHYTGAVPAEHYSSEKRPEYKRYQEEVNMFFPGWRKVKQS